MSKKAFGFSLLADQVGEYLAAEYEWMEKDNPYAIGDTAIERLLYAAVRVRCQIGATEYKLWAVHSEKMLAEMQAETSFDPLLIVFPQFEVKNRRVDFLFTAMDYRVQDKEVWRRLLVECDGHDFHERTKEQAARDRSKDRQALMEGYDSFRFTGSELWRDPWGCAEQICDWAARGLP